MTYEYIVNPLSGRKVNINNRLGKQIINNYVRMHGGVNWREGFKRVGSAVKTGAKKTTNVVKTAAKVSAEKTGQATKAAAQWSREKTSPVLNRAANTARSVASSAKNAATIAARVSAEKAGQAKRAATQWSKDKVAPKLRTVASATSAAAARAATSTFTAAQQKKKQLGDWNTQRKCKNAYKQIEESRNYIANNCQPTTTSIKPVNNENKLKTIAQNVRVTNMLRNTAQNAGKK